jgi:hypothetical protein
VIRTDGYRVSEPGGMYALAVVDARRLGDRLLGWLSLFSLAAAGAALWIIQDRRVAAYAALFNVCVAMLYRMPLYRRLPASLVISCNIAAFFSIPIVYIGFRGPAYEFVERFTAPGSNSDYFAALPSAIVSALAYLAVVLAGLIAGHGLSCQFRRRTPAGSRRRDLLPLAGLGLLVASVAMVDNSRFFAAIAESTGKVNALLPFLLLDHAYLLLFPLLLYGPSPSVERLRERQPQFAFLFVVGLFLVVFLSATSKAAILNLTWYLFIFPLAYYYPGGKRVYWPSKLMVAAALVSAVPLFFLAQAQRQAMMAGDARGVRGTIERVASEAAAGYGQLLTTVADRVSSSFHSYVMIHAQFGQSYDAAYAREFAGYLRRSFSNLVLPGTPYPEAYFPSSQLLASVLARDRLVGVGDAVTFWEQANTQPYSGFGALVVLLGPWFAVPVLFAVGFLFAVAFNAAPHLLVRVCLLFLVNAGFQVYGLESTVQVAIHVGVAATFMLILLSISRVGFALPRWIQPRRREAPL